MIAILSYLVATKLHQLPPGGVDLLGNRPLKIRDGGIAEGTGRVGSAEVWVKKKGEFAYNVELVTPKFNRALHAGEIVFFSYQARCLEAKNESETGFFNAYTQRGGPPYDGFGFNSGGLNKNWRQFYFLAKVDKDYEADKVEYTFHLADLEQRLEFKDFSVLWYPKGTSDSIFPITKLTYPGREANAPWRAKAAAMIEKNRKGDLSISVTKNGKPLRSATVKVQMLRHNYPFATYSEFDKQNDPVNDAKYKEMMLTNRFSRVTVPIYWSDWGWLNPKTRKDFLGVIKWATDNKVRMKAHNLFWPGETYLPKKFLKLEGDVLRTELYAALDEQLSVLKDTNFENIDVVNEIKTNRFIQDKIGDSIISDYFKRTKKVFPKADLVYNDYAIFEGIGGGGTNFGKASKAAQDLLKMGAPLTLCGWQGHFGEDLTDPELVWKSIDRWKKETGLPVEITEFDINTRDEIVQADYTRDLLTAWFAHPETKGFTIWGFFESSHWIPNGAMYRKDWSPKPNALVWDKLITKDWWTDVTVVTDKNGQAKVRGFLGDYKIISGGKEILLSLPKAGTTTKISL
jgi:endo-1,4-beta-xylanase